MLKGERAWKCGEGKVRELRQTFLIDIKSETETEQLQSRLLALGEGGGGKHFARKTNEMTPAGEGRW